ncbi:hypothetical protein BH10BAC2_BH10BAC2_40010 [soil metagenome]
METNLIIAANNQIILENKSRYFYTVKPFEMTNILGNVIAVLEEYTFVRNELNNEDVIYKFYKTKEGSWYDMEEPKLFLEKAVIRMLKTAIDSNKNAIIQERGRSIKIGV